MGSSFERVAIVNRGEPAMRLIHAVRELNAAGAGPLKAIALYTEADRHALFVREADEAFDLGPVFAVGADGVRRSAYLDHQRLERALVATRAEAVWPGWGFVAEDAGFADLCARLGIVFVGPSGDVMRRLGDKIESKRLAERVGVSVSPWSGGAVESVEAAREAADRIGFPLVIKATAGGGGRGIRRVDRAEELAEAFERARSEAGKAFGDPTVFMEKMLLGVRHVEVQAIADFHGTVWAAGVRDCTVQRRNQKVFEEAPSPALSADADRRLREAAVRLCAAAGYRNAGTVEFLLDAASGETWFMEVNARLQVEHPVTEVTTGLDMVKLQLHVAAGGRLPGPEPPPTEGHAIEARLNAEDPDNGFAPAPGTVELLRLAAGPGVRIDAGLAEGDSIPSEFDSMIAKVIATGRDRQEAVGRLSRALAQSRAVVRGGTTNRTFLLELLDDADFRANAIDVRWLDRRVGEPPRERAGGQVAILRAALDAYEAELDLERLRFLAKGQSGRPEVADEIGRTIELRHAGVDYAPRVYRRGRDRYRVAIGGVEIEIAVDRFARSGFRERRMRGSDWRLTIAGRSCRVGSVAEGATSRVEVDGVAHRVSRDEGGLVRAPAPAVVVAVSVAEGDEVAAGDRLLVIEAMKMEMPVLAPSAARVREVLVRSNVQVAAGAPLMRLEPLSQGSAAAAAAPLDFAPFAASPPADRESRFRAAAGRLRCLVLGYDVDAAAARQLAAMWDDLGREAERLTPEQVRACDEVLFAFADLASLFRRQTEEEGESEDGFSGEEHLFTFLRNPERGAERLPKRFLDKLQRALAQYDVQGLERSPELDEALFRIGRARRREEEMLRPILAALERRARGGPIDDALRALLGRVVTDTHQRFPTVSERARELRYELFERPLLEETRGGVFAEAEAQVAALVGGLPAAERAARMQALVDCPQPLAGLFASRYAASDRAARLVRIEALTRRYYRMRAIEAVAPLALEGGDAVTASYHWEGRDIALLTLIGPLADLPTLSARASAWAASVPHDQDPIIDLFVWADRPLGGEEETATAVDEALRAVHFPRPPRRLVVGVSGPRRGDSSFSTQHFTYRPAPGGVAEERFYRGVHPMIAKRLRIWRLSTFHLERLPSAEDVYLLRAVARDNPKDERFFAVAEVRDLTPVRDAEGRIVQMPHLERQLLEAFSAIRRAQAARPPDKRLFWNRVLLYVWPEFPFSFDEVRTFARRMAPASEGLGLELVMMRARMPRPPAGEVRDTVLYMAPTGGGGIRFSFQEPTDDPIQPLTEYEQKVVRLRQRGLADPFEIVALIANAREDAAPGLRAGEFTEYDLDASNRLTPVERPPGRNSANVVVGVIRNFTRRYPEGMTRVLLLGDASRDLGALAEPECRRIVAAIDLARKMRVPLDWFALSAGAKIAMDSGTENMDWIALVLRHLVRFTQAGGEVNVVVNGINVGAQPYWNAESTMLMHTRGVLIMMPESAMVLTGKRALDFSGGVSAEDNQGIGGYERVMGPNGQAQYFARDLPEACRQLLRYHELAWQAPGERFPRRAETNDPVDRDVCLSPYAKADGSGFRHIGEVLSEAGNPGKKKAFDVREVLAAVVDQDHPPLERWAGWRDAEMAVVWDARLGGHSVSLLGMESRPLPRLGFLPADGPDQWTAGTLFPQSSRKVARALNAASGRRPVVFLANLSGFDGSPESLRNWQLEYGAEIGRAVVNFDGPLIFCVISRYHGGAFVVFSNALNEGLETAAIEGTFASVIGGAPAAAVVFAREVENRARTDRRVLELEAQLKEASGAARSVLAARLAELRREVHSEKLGEMAQEFDTVHSIERAQRVGSVERILAPERLRPYLIEAIERGQRRTAEADRRPPAEDPLER